MKRTKLKRKIQTKRLLLFVKHMALSSIVTILICIAVLHVAHAKKQLNEQQSDMLLYECCTGEISSTQSYHKKSNQERTQISTDSVKDTEPVEIQGIISENLVINKERTIYFDIPLSHELQDYIFTESKKAGLPAELVIAMIRKESSFDPSARSESMDTGLMQINDINLPELESLGLTDMYDPYQNIQAGIYLLKRCMKQGGDINPALMVYNMGYKGAKELWNQGIWSSEYSRAIYKYYLDYLEYTKSCRD